MITLVRCALTIIGLFFLSMPAFRNYSKLFPDHLLMEVYFDTEGTRASLGQFKKSEIVSLSIDPNWERAKGKYVEFLTSELRHRIAPEAAFSFDGKQANVHSEGDTSFVVEPAVGWQEYRIVHASGRLEHRNFSTLERTTCTLLLPTFTCLPAGLRC